MSSRGYSLEKRGKDAWRVIVSMGWNEAEQRYDKYSENIRATTKTDAHLQAEIIRDRIKSGLDTTAKNITVKDWIDSFLKAKASGLEAQTIYHYQNKMNRYIYPCIGTMKLKDLTIVTLDRLYTNLLKEGGTKGGKLSVKTVKQCHVIITGALKKAVGHRLIPYNPAASIELPRPEEKEKSILQVADTVTLDNALSALDDHDLLAALQIGFGTGMRRSEVCGLVWGDINWKRSTIRVERTYKRTSGAGLAYGKVKTKGSRRVIAMGKELRKQLLDHKLWQGKEFINGGGQQNDQTPVVMKHLAEPMPPDHLTKRVRRFFDSIGMSDLSFHSLRHTQATYLLMSDTPLKVVQERLGHTSAATTLDIYGHVMDGQDKAAADTFSQVIEQIKANPTKNDFPQFFPKKDRQS